MVKRGVGGVSRAQSGRGLTQRGVARVKRGMAGVSRDQSGCGLAQRGFQGLKEAWQESKGLKVGGSEPKRAWLSSQVRGRGL